MTAEKQVKTVQIKYANKHFGGFSTKIDKPFEYGCEERTNRVHEFLKENPEFNVAHHEVTDYLVEMIHPDYETSYDEVWELGA